MSQISNNNKTQNCMESESRTQSKKKSSRRYIGIILTFLSSISFSLGVLLVKILSDSVVVNNPFSTVFSFSSFTSSKRYHPLVLGVWRFIGITVLTSPFLFFHYICNGKQSLQITESGLETNCFSRFNTFILLCSRWFFGCNAILLQFISLQYISLADSLVITFSTPIFVILVAHRILNEKAGIVTFVVAFMTLFGVFIMARPPIFTGRASFDYNILIGIGYAIGGMTCTGISFILMRFLREIHFSVVITYFGIWGVIECLIAAFVIGLKLEDIIPMGAHDWILAYVLAILSFMGQITLTGAMKFEQASIVSCLRTCDVLFGFIWQYAFLNIVPDIYSGLGSVFVVFGVLLIGFRKWLTQQPEDSEMKAKFWIILK